ncbi:MAG: DUF6666 family protein [Thermoguttaceae bacterium]
MSPKKQNEPIRLVLAEQNPNDDSWTVQADYGFPEPAQSVQPAQNTKSSQSSQLSQLPQLSQNTQSLQDTDSFEESFDVKNNVGNPSDVNFSSSDFDNFGSSGPNGADFNETGYNESGFDEFGIVHSTVEGENFGGTVVEDVQFTDSSEQGGQNEVPFDPIEESFELGFGPESSLPEKTNSIQPGGPNQQRIPGNQPMMSKQPVTSAPTSLPNVQSNRTATSPKERSTPRIRPDDQRLQLDSRLDLDNMEKSTIFPTTEDQGLGMDPELQKIIDSRPQIDKTTGPPSRAQIIDPTQGRNTGSRPTPNLPPLESETNWESRDRQRPALPPSLPSTQRIPQSSVPRVRSQEEWKERDSDKTRETDSTIGSRPQQEGQTQGGSSPSIDRELEFRQDAGRESDSVGNQTRPEPRNDIQPIADSSLNVKTSATSCATNCSDSCQIGPPIVFYDQDCRNLGMPGFAWDWNPSAPLFSLGTMPTGTDFFGYPKAVDCAVRPYGWLFDNMTLFAGGTSFGSQAGPITEENFGVQEGVNWSGTFAPRLGINAQLGVRAVQRTLQVEHPVLGTWNSSGKGQSFITAGLFRRAQCNPFQWGLVYDWMSDNKYEKNLSLGQIRMEFSGRTAHGCTIGFRGAFSLNTSNPFEAESEQFRLQAVDQFLGFIETQVYCNTLLSFNAGLSGSGQAILSGSIEQPISDKFSIKTDLAYMIASGNDVGPAPASYKDVRRDSWGLSLSLVFHPHGGAYSRSCNPLRALFDVADNTSMFTTPVYR